MKNYCKLFSVLFLSICFFTSCGKTDPDSLQAKFGNDSFYFMGLQAADNQDDKKAIRFFKTAREKGSSLIAKRSAESLTLVGSVKQRLAAAKYLVETWPDECNEILVASREYFRNNEISQVILITNDLDLNLAPNELIQLRFNSLLEKKDARFVNEYYQWCINRQFSIDHLSFYQKYLELTGIPVNEDSDLDSVIQKSRKALTDNQKILEFRRNVYNRNWNAAYNSIDEIIEIYAKRNNEFENTILSDLGKATFYGTDNFYKSAQKFDKFVETLPDEKKFFAYFYAARMYDKAGRYQKITVQRFNSALEKAVDDAQFDNCLWYLLDFQLRTSIDDIITTLKVYGAKIHEADYFDDFFDSLAVILISGHKWQDFYKIWKETNSNLSGYITGKFAYITGRLIEEGLAKGGAEDKTRQAVDAFTIALTEGTSVYYKVCALERLNILDSEYVESILLSRGQNVNSESAQIEKTDAGILLDGYAAFGYPDKIYLEWQINRKDMTFEESVQVAKFLADCSEIDTNYAVQSLRMATWVKENSLGKLSRELTELVYPRYYQNLIAKACEANSLPEYLMYALVRTESFFDANANSNAGAMGLTQLMDFTAEEEAKKMKIAEDFDIFDPETNLNIGTHYLASLISKAEANNKLLAVCGYNGGAGNVRKWIRGAKRDWATTRRKPVDISGIAIDLWLETVPYEETRNYGKKLISTSAMYGWLYYNQQPCDIVREMFGW